MGGKIYPESLKRLIHLSRKVFHESATVFPRKATVNSVKQKFFSPPSTVNEEDKSAARHLNKYFKKNRTNSPLEISQSSNFSRISIARIIEFRITRIPNISYISKMFSGQR